MLTVRCLSCQHVFATSATSKHTDVQCPACKATHPLGSLATSTAGDSMLISAGALKQILESPKGPEAARSHVRPEPVIFCPSCKVRLYVNRKKYGGKRVNCPECGKPMLVPRLSQDVTVAEAAPDRADEEEGEEE